MGLNHDPGGGGPLDGCSVAGCAFFFVLGSEMTCCLINRDHVLEVKVINPICNGLERSVFFRSTLNAVLPASVFKKQKCFFVLFFIMVFFCCGKVFFSAFFSSKCVFFFLIMLAKVKFCKF